METMRTLVSQGKSIIFISHKLNEVQAVADRLTVLRKGKATAEGIDPQGLTRTQLAELMVGREVIFQVDKLEREPGKVVLEVDNLSADNNRGLPAVRGVSFQIREGEIFGFAGIAGNGQSELVEAVTGLRSSEGSIRINGTEVGNCSPRKSIRCGLAHIPRRSYWSRYSAESLHYQKRYHEELHSESDQQWLADQLCRCSRSCKWFEREL